MSRSERWLVFLLRFGGVLTGSAVFAVFLPAAWMDSIHRDLGLGELPSAPITDYLTRSLSAMYAIHGGLLLVLSTDVRRYRNVIAYVGWATLALGLVVTWIDVRAGLPMWWILGEGPWVTVIGAVIARLAAVTRPASP